MSCLADMASVERGWVAAKLVDGLAWYVELLVVFGKYGLKLQQQHHFSEGF